MYCGMSLGRVGLDFRGLLSPIFEASVPRHLRLQHQGSRGHLPPGAGRAQVGCHAERGLPKPPCRGCGSRNRDETPRHEDGGPPYVLMDHPPLAILANGILAALNELRHCAPLAVAHSLGSILQEGLSAAVRAMAHCKATRLLPDEEGQLLEGACDALIFTLVPYISTCFTKVYPGIHIDTSQVVAALTPPTPQPVAKPSASLTGEVPGGRPGDSSGRKPGEAAAVKPGDVPSSNVPSGDASLAEPRVGNSKDVSLEKVPGSNTVESAAVPAAFTESAPVTIASTGSEAAVASAAPVPPGEPAVEPAGQPAAGSGDAPPGAAV
eukprot:jgi/Botrbrau1/13980/Bobra.117_2s0010.1